MHAKHDADDIEGLSTGLYKKVQFGRGLAHVVEHAAHNKSSRPEQGHKEIVHGDGLPPRVVPGLLHEPAQLEQRVGALTGSHHGRQLAPVAPLVEHVGQPEHRDDVVRQHHRALCLHVHAPGEVEQEVAEADDHDGCVEVGALLPQVAKWPGAEVGGREEAEAGRQDTVDGGDDPAVPLGRLTAVECMEDEVEVCPEQEAANDSIEDVLIPASRHHHGLKVWGQEATRVSTILSLGGEWVHLVHGQLIHSRCTRLLH